jgi:hypothetical protein
VIQVASVPISQELSPFADNPEGYCMNGLTKEDSGRIALVTSSLFAGALDLNELHEWAVSILAQEQNPPLYIIDLMEFNEARFKIYNTIGFVPRWPYPARQKVALVGIAYRRGRDLFDPPYSRQEALDALQQYPHIEAAFRAEFPFVNF